SERRLAEHCLEQLAVARTKAAAMGPVDVDGAPEGSAKERVHRHASRLRSDVDARILDGCNRLVTEATRGEQRLRMQPRGELRELRRVFAKHLTPELANDLRQRGAPRALGELRPSREPVVGHDL